MVSESITRKNFIRNSSIAIAGLMASNHSLNAAPTPDKDASSTSFKANHFVLKNVRLETGFEYEENEIIATKTALFSIEVENGDIKAIHPNTADKNAIDAKGLLMLPAFKDMHIHLDKTFYGGPWKATQRRQGGVKGMIALEQKIIPELLKTSTYRAEKLIELLQSKGSSFARSHVNIDPTSKLDSLKNLQKALDNKKNSFDAELVAFPQHGVYYTDSEKWMKDAATSVDFIGGLDPYSIDGNMEKQMDFIVKLALDNNKGIDIHLHEGGESGLKTVEYLIDRVNENPALKGKSYLSHCFVLGRLDKKKQEEIAEKLADAKVGIVSTIPFGGLIMPIPTLYKYGVDVMTGNDSIIDHWNTWGSGSVLQKANLMAQLYGYGTEFDLSRSLKLATHNVLPLDDEGKQQWPKAGDKANFVLINASCSAEAVSRISPVESLIHNGKIVY